MALANIFWAGNWVTGRALRDVFDPLAINFWRWLIAAVILAPVALPDAMRNISVVRRHAGILFLLSLTGVVLFQSLVYLGLRSTTAVNGVLLNSSLPLFILLCSWIIDRERATPRQLVGVSISLSGILIIVARGELDTLLRLEFHAGDAWILLAMPTWGVYSVLLKRRPSEIGDVPFLFVISLAGVLMLGPWYALDAFCAAPASPTLASIAGVLYIGIAASVFAFIFWNRGVSVVGANAAGVTLHLLPAFGAMFAMVFLGESFGGFHAIGFVAILAGVVFATHRSATGASK